MSTVNNSNGFVFVNKEGQYAYTSQSTGFAATKDVIYWSRDLSQAQIFPHEAMARRKFKELEKCQALMAVATRVVSISDWSEKAAPVMPIAPEEYRPFPPSSLQRPAWQCLDRDRRVFIDGAMRYFGDNEALPAKVKHDQVEFQYGREAWMVKNKGGE